MKVPTRFLRIFKLLGKTLLGLFLILLIVVALLHLPPVQNQITRSLVTYLSTRLEARVDIQKINFSMLGNVEIDDLEVWDPDQNKIFSAHQIKVKSNLYDLITGKLIFDEVRISGAKGTLLQDVGGLNIKFIIDAFRTKEKKAATQSSVVTLQFNKIELDTILFEYTSQLNGISVSVNLGTFTIQRAELLTKPFTIKVGQVGLEHTGVTVLSKTQPTPSTNTQSLVSENKNFLSPDFGMGIIFEVGALTLSDNDVSFHKDQIRQTKKFDPTHLDIKNIDVNLSRILIRKDSLAADLQSLSVQLPGFTLTKALAGMHMNPNQVFLSGVQFTAGKNEIQAELIGPTSLKISKENEHKPIEIAVEGRIDPKDIAYFFNDSLINLVKPWGPTLVSIESKYSQGKGEISKLNLKTRNSQLQVNGKLADVFNEKISWRNLTVRTTIGSDFQKLLTPLVKNIQLPPELSLHLKSSGNLNKVTLDGNVASPWGDANVTGQVVPTSNIQIDLTLNGEKIDLGNWLNLPWLGPMNLSARANGRIGGDQNLEVSGLINRIEILEQPIHTIRFETQIKKDSSTISIAIQDPNYRATIGSKISFREPLAFTNIIVFDNFKPGRLLNGDSTLSITGHTTSELILSPSFLQGSVIGNQLVFEKKSIAHSYSMDSLSLHAYIAPTRSDFEFDTDNTKAKLVSNFDIREAGEVMQRWSGNLLRASASSLETPGNRTAKFSVNLENADFIKWLGLDVNDFSLLQIAGEFDEAKETASMLATSGNFTGYGVALDTVNSQWIVLGDTLTGRLNVQNLRYDSIPLGNLDFEVLTKQDTSFTSLLLSTDTTTLLGLNARVVLTDSAAFIYPESLQAFNDDYTIDPKNAVLIKKNNIVFHEFAVRGDEMKINLHGDLNYFDVQLENIDLTRLNFLLSSDTTVINKGRLTGNVSYSPDQKINLQAEIDSLSLYNSDELTLKASAESEGDQVPFEFLLTNKTNKIDLQGRYFSLNKEVDANLLLDINNLEMFQIFLEGTIEHMIGELKGVATISGPLKRPVFNGYLQFLNTEVTTINPRLTFNVKDDKVVLDNSALRFDHFTLYDKEKHPLTIDGNVTSKDYQSYAYDLRIKSDQYTLINNPDTTNTKVRGLLVLDSEIKLKGDGKNTNIDADLAIKNATDLTYVLASEDNELMKAAGIVDFVDPVTESDSLSINLSGTFYDSLIASLPDFNLNSRISIEDKAVLRLLIDEQSGDYIEASGGANLEMNYDRSGNLNLAGNYTIKKGVYRLSFYDLVKKNFNLVSGSTVNWSGGAKEGGLSIKAIHTVESNSLGLIGHEIGENEKSIYKRSLDYQVGINIDGTIDKPIVSFSLDLPQNEKVNYPVLANKLDRLRQPEYASELNKQVFALLVLGGFLPESSADVNSQVVATTALYNSVNSLLASQFNRFANQYVKGVNIDVGIQSYSDYSAPGGKTQTAMDFRVSKKIMDDRLSFEIGGDFDINTDQSGSNKGDNYRGDVAIIYDLTGNGDKQLKLFNNETYDIIYQEIRNTGISLILIREFENKKENKRKRK